MISTNSKRISSAPEDFVSLRHVMVGVEKLPDGLAAAFEEKFGITAVELYLADAIAKSRIE